MFSIKKEWLTYADASVAFPYFLKHFKLLILKEEENVFWLRETTLFALQANLNSS